MTIPLPPALRHVSEALLAVGPVPHVDDAVGSKVTALVWGGLPGNYLDVAGVLRRCDLAQLLAPVYARDPGLRMLDVALATSDLIVTLRLALNRSRPS